MSTQSAIVVLLALVLAGGGAYVLWTQGKLPQIPGLPAPRGVLCTQDAMQCPDGTWVSRTGPDCEFVCPNMPQGGPGEGILPYNSGVRGTVMVGPTCPVEQSPSEPNCADKPFSTLVAIFRASDPVHAFVLTRADAQGRFEADLPPGEYMIGAGESQLPSCPITEVVVEEDSYAEITINCYSGIR